MSIKIKQIPNILTVIRIVLVPVFMIFFIFDIFPTDTVTLVVGAALFGAITLTDMYDGKIARKYNAISDFGKFLDPIADKLLVIGAMMALIIYYMKRANDRNGYRVFAIAMTFSVFIIVARELAVTALRLICKNTGGQVIAANMAGKTKTCAQIVFILAACIEPIIMSDSLWLSYLSMLFMTFMTVYSGWIYFKTYLPQLKEQSRVVIEDEE